MKTLDIKSLLAVIFYGTNGFAVLLIMPLLVGGMIETYDFSEQNAGYASSIELFGLALSSILSLFWIKKINWALVAFVSMLGLSFCNILVAWVNDYSGFMLLRFFAGVFAGAGCAITATAIAQAKNSDRNFGYYIVGQLIFATILFWWLPHWIGVKGIDFAYGVLAFCAFLSLFFIRKTPCYQDNKEALNTAQGTCVPVLIIGFLLLSTFLFLMVQGSIWAYIERMGTYSGLSIEEYGLGLSIASIAGLFSAIIVAFINGKIGYFWPIVIFIVAQIYALYELMNKMSFLSYTLSSSIFNFAWCAIVPILFAMLAASDRSGRAATIGSGVISAGLALGPAAAALTLVDGEGYVLLCVLGMVALFASLLLSLPGVFYLKKANVV